ncbi:Os07g0259501 [Oryza sativa Japonica Group]|uniref:Os07g0259501 protein n=1 Tax=Oryza sativa subsp. japonica TaxID=39947 RepID=A0A0P0X4L0_ORYSJ|nr:Os07g0259501 [Oryza sativa Japonica Group]
MATVDSWSSWSLWTRCHHRWIRAPPAPDPPLPSTPALPSTATRATTACTSHLTAAIPHLRRCHQWGGRRRHRICSPSLPPPAPLMPKATSTASEA